MAPERQPGEISAEERKRHRERVELARERQRIRDQQRPANRPDPERWWDRSDRTTATETPAVIAEDVVVRYQIRGDGRSLFRRKSNEVLAVDQVSLSIHKGEAFGIIGRNGAGKTTMVKVLAGTLPPDEGRVVSFGAVPAMLGMGVGFNRKLSGRRNIYLGCLASGMRYREVQGMVDDIVDFAELGPAIDRSVDTYSAGMYARLAFSVAIQSRPDILLVDEALTVGDQGFRKKSKEAMEDILQGAGTIVLVSHGLRKMEQFCDRIAWLDQGKLIQVGEPSEVIAAYRSFLGVDDDGDDSDGGLEAAFLRGDDDDDDF